MAELIGFALIIGIPWYLCKREDWKASHRLPPEGKMHDSNAVIRDAVNEMSKNDIYKKMNRGGYDIPKK